MFQQFPDFEVTFMRCWMIWFFGGELSCSILFIVLEFGIKFIGSEGKLFKPSLKFAIK